MKLATVTYTDGRTLPYDVEIRRVRNSVCRSPVSVTW
jgi:hypothetical protein